MRVYDALTRWIEGKAAECEANARRIDRMELEEEVEEKQPLIGFYVDEDPEEIEVVGPFDD